MTRRRQARAVAACLLLAATAACGRSGLYTSDELVLFGGSGGTSSSAGSDAGRGGVGAVAGQGGAGRAGSGGVAGMPVVAGSAGMPDECQGAPLQIRGFSPLNGAPAPLIPDWVVVQYQCPIDRMRVSSDSARLYGTASGFVATAFPLGNDLRFLSLDPQPRSNQDEAWFAGERVTAWLGEALGGPYQWQFTAPVKQLEPVRFRATLPIVTIERAYASGLGDVDADGDLDALVQGPDSLLLLRNTGGGVLDTPEVLPASGRAILGDVDRDGDLDVVADDALLRNDGTGHFALSTGPRGSCVAAGDLDGDGDLDCVVSVSTNLGHVVFNDGSGQFKEGPSTPFGFECELADLDDDGDLDAACVSPVVEAGRIFFNDGSGAFKQAEQVLGVVGARGIALGDLDADGDIDAVVSQWFGGGKTSPNQVWLNDGVGSFVESGSVGSDGGSVAVADYDGDGDFDVIFSHLTPYGPGGPPFNPIRIYSNDGRAHFKNSESTLGDPAYHWFKLGDLDRDGDLDAAVFHQLGPGNSYISVWLNDY